MCHAGTWENKIMNKPQESRMAEYLALASISESTKKRTWTSERCGCRRHRQKKGPWLCERDGIDCAARELTKIMALHCFLYKKQSQMVKGNLAAVTYFHNMFAGWGLPTSPCIIVAVGKGIDRAHENPMLHLEKRKRSRGPYFSQ